MSQKSPIGKNELPWKMLKTPKKPAVTTVEKAAKSVTKKAKKSLKSFF